MPDSQLEMKDWLEMDNANDNNGFPVSDAHVFDNSDPEFHIVGLAGLRLLLDTIERAWERGNSVTIQCARVVFKPSCVNGASVHFHAEVLEVE